MAKKPWEEKIVNNDGEKISRKLKGSIASTPFLTALLSVFFVIVVAILFIVFYTSNRGGNKVEETSNFYGAPSKSTSSSKKGEGSQGSEAEGEESTEETTESSTDKKGETITVLPGEGPSSIAARAGISLEELYELNPEHMSTGSWYADPGDQVYIN